MHCIYIQVESDQSLPVTRKSRRTVVAVIVAFLILVVIFVAPVIHSTAGAPYETQTEVSTRIFVLPDSTIQGDHYEYVTAPLTKGTNASVTWSASNTLNAYVFNSAGFAQYQASEMRTTTSVASELNSSGSTIAFRVSITDTYYFVVFNPHFGLLGLNAQSVDLHSAGGMTNSLEVITLTSSTTCNMNLIDEIARGHC